MTAKNKRLESGTDADRLWNQPGPRLLRKEDFQQHEILCQGLWQGRHNSKKDEHTTTDLAQ